ncbi:MAG TPA: lamin tail domain-containing protein [Kofleriaceae bacterium]|nr:lamin tail domain-containing protein [Kofleriaceae bacterium]
MNRRVAIGPGLALALAACGDNLIVPPPAPRGQGSEATSDLVINEIAPRGDGADWVELYNRTVTPIDLCGVFFTDAVDRLDHYLPLGGVMPPAPCPARTLAPGDRLVVYADDTPIVDGTPIDPAHAPFELGVADEVHLISTDGAVIDGLLFLYPPGPDAPADVTLSRDPDGQGMFFPRAPTPAFANVAEVDAP